MTTKLIPLTALELLADRSITAGNAQILAKLHKTRSTICKHIARGDAMTCRNGEPNWRSRELVDRYNALKAALIGDHAARDVPQWKSYCDAYGSDLRHGGYDLIKRVQRKPLHVDLA